MTTFTGVITALVTPFRNDAIDEAALRRLVEEQIAAGVDGLVPVGTTGESPTLTSEEHIRVVKVVVEAAKKRVPVIAGTGGNSTREAIELSQAAREVGADGMLQVTPYYNRPGQDHLYRHFKAIVEAVPLPTILYNVPSRTGCDLLPETIARLCELPQIVGVKEATGSALRAMQVIARVGDRLPVLSGDDAVAFPLFALGARGVISVVSNVAPADMSAMWDAAAAGNWQRARELHYKLLPLSEGLFVEVNPIPVKAALAMMGRIADELRPPLYPLAGGHREKLRAALAELKLV
jgi:4-hydroxy-tetrahydrodipicolinate synthase